MAENGPQADVKSGFGCRRIDLACCDCDYRLVFFGHLERWFSVEVSFPPKIGCSRSRVFSENLPCNGRHGMAFEGHGLSLT